MLPAEEERAVWARNARRVSDRYLVFTQVRRWLEVLVQTVRRSEAMSVDGTASREGS